MFTIPGTYYMDGEERLFMYVLLFFPKASCDSIYFQEYNVLVNEVRGLLIIYTPCQFGLVI